MDTTEQPAAGEALEVLQTAAPAATDRGTIRIVVIIVGLLALACVGGVIGLAATATAIPSTLDVTTGAALGGLLALLVSTRSTGA